MKRMLNRTALLLTILALSLELCASDKTYNQSPAYVNDNDEEEEIISCQNDNTYYNDSYENEPFYDEYNENAHPLEED